jgi:phospholipid/cholesterol/gamma-HCH transport system ATP-binding protein
MIRFEQVSKSFSQKKVFADLSFEIQAGEIVFVLGTSGTGKSVLLKCLVGLLRPDSGKIYIKNQQVNELSEDEYLSVRKMCGMVFQNPALFDSLTVYENIAFGLRRMGSLSEAEMVERVDATLEMVNLPDIKSSLPNEISLGQQKRVSLARTLALRPEILLFDEPTTGLDPISTTAINLLIKNLSRQLKTTSIVVSHDMKCAFDIADRVIVLDQGQIAESGTPAQLRRSQVHIVKEFLLELEAV